jgi:hypothetical protein
MHNCIPVLLFMLGGSQTPRAVDRTLTVTLLVATHDIVLSEPLDVTILLRNNSKDTLREDLGALGHLETRPPGGSWTTCTSGPTPSPTYHQGTPLLPSATREQHFDPTMLCSWAIPDTRELRFVYDSTEAASRPGTNDLWIGVAVSETVPVTLREPTGIDREALNAARAGMPWSDVCSTFSSVNLRWLSTV